MSYQLRKGEPFYLPILKRKDRLVLDDNGYYYKSRECDLVGPFNSEDEALDHLSIFIEVIKIEKNLQLDGSKKTG